MARQNTRDKTGFLEKLDTDRWELILAAILLGGNAVIFGLFEGTTRVVSGVTFNLSFSAILLKMNLAKQKRTILKQLEANRKEVIQQQERQVESLIQVTRDIDSRVMELMDVPVTEQGHEILKVYAADLAIAAMRQAGKLAKQETPVATLLLNVAERFLGQDHSTIKALCSTKGQYGDTYYKSQFEWVAGKKGRTLQRIFVSDKDGEFPPEEERGILQHAKAGRRKKALGTIETRWLREDEPLLRGRYSESFGFAIIGQSLIVHWGTSHGGFIDSAVQDPDYGMITVFQRRFQELWDAAIPIDKDLVDRIEKRVKGGVVP